jgi:hypothetical protein
METSKARHDSYMAGLQGFYDVVVANRAELNPTGDDPDYAADADELPKVEITPDLL